MERKPGKLANFIYDILFYRNYHSYKKALGRLKSLGLLIIIMGCAGSFNVGNIGQELMNWTLLSLLVLMLMYYITNIKANRIRRDSKEVKKRVASTGYISDVWNIYDGIYNVSEEMSLELSFTHERSFIENVWKIFFSKKAAAMLPANDDLKMLKRYVRDIQKLKENSEVNINVYATLDQKLKERLEEEGFDLISIERKYISQPLRLDYAGDYKDKKKLISYNRKNFGAYLIALP